MVRLESVREPGSLILPEGGAPAEGGMRNDELADRRVGFHSLTPELLIEVVKALALSAYVDKEGGGQEGNPLLYLRCVSRGMRDAVDKAKTGHSFEITSQGALMFKNVRNGPVLLRALQGFQRSLPRWPHLVHLSLVFDWPSDHLHVALATIAASSPGLTNLFLEAQCEDMQKELVHYPILTPLAALPNLSVLHLTGFRVFHLWFMGLSSLSSLTKLHLYDQGVLVLEPPLPPLQDFEIYGTFPGPPFDTTALSSLSPEGPRVDLDCLSESPSLTRLCLGDVSMSTLPLPPGHSTLTVLELDNVRFSSTTTGLATLLRGPPPLPSLKTLLLADMFDDLPENLPLGACTGLTSLTLRFLPGVASLQSLSTLGSLHTLVLHNLRRLEELPLPGPAGSSLEKLELLYLDRLGHLPGLGAFLNLRELTLTHVKLIADAPGLGTLTRLETLVIDSCPNIEVPPASLASLVKLKCLRFIRAVAVEGGMLNLTLPAPPALCELERLELGHWKDVEGLNVICTTYTKLSSLTLSSIEDLWEMPSTFNQLHSLTELSISGCSALGGIVLWGLRSLASLTLDNLNHDWPLPGLDHLEVLQTLVIKRFALLTAIEDLSSNLKLASVSIEDCSRLHEVNLRGSTALRNLSIDSCFELEEVTVGPLAEIDFKDCPCLCRIRR